MSVTTLPLGEISTEIVSGIACGKANAVADGVLHLRPFSVTTNGSLSISDAPRIPASLVPNGRLGFQAGDILFNNTNSVELVGKSAVFSASLEASFSNHMTRVRIDAAKADPWYVQAFLRRLYHQRFFEGRATRWVGQAAFGTAQLKAIEIPLAPLAEQRRIVGILDRAGEIRSRADAARAKARAVIPALFLNMFGDPATNPKGWRALRLGDALLSGPQNGLYRPASDYGEGTRILRIDSFDDGSISDQHSLKRLRMDGATIEKFGLRQGDIVVNRVNSPPQLGKSVLIPELEEPTVFESNMMRMRVNPEILAPEVVGPMLQLDSIRQALIKNAKHAINQSSINQGDVTGVIIFAPPHPLQTTFTEQARRLQATARALDVTAARAEAMASALSAEVFDQPRAQGNGLVSAQAAE